MRHRNESATQAIGAFIKTVREARALVDAGKLTPALYGRLLVAEDLLDIVDERLLHIRHSHTVFAAAPALRRRLRQVCADTRTLARS
jgi:hypothetical protein